MRGVLLSFVVAIGMAFTVPTTDSLLMASGGETTFLALQQPAPTPSPDPTPDLTVDLDVDRETTTVWYADPVWLALGGLGVLIVVLLIVFAVRGNSTTIVKE